MKEQILKETHQSLLIDSIQAPVLEAQHRRKAHKHLSNWFKISMGHSSSTKATQIALELITKRKTC